MFDINNILQILILFTVVLYTSLSLLFSSWITAGIYLIGVGFLLLNNDADILVGFLWLIDLGVGLIFLTFIVYLFAYFSQRATTEIVVRNFTLSVYFIFFLFLFYTVLGLNTANIFQQSSSWFFYISWYDYYDFFTLDNTTDLLILRDLYFHSNSFEFMIVSFMGFYGIIACVLLTMVIKRSIHYFSKNLYDSFEFTQRPHFSIFIRNQNFLQQRNTTAGSRVWFKRRNTIKQSK